MHKALPFYTGPSVDAYAGAGRRSPPRRLDRPRLRDARVRAQHQVLPREALILRRQVLHLIGHGSSGIVQKAVSGAAYAGMRLSSPRA